MNTPAQVPSAPAEATAAPVIFTFQNGKPHAVRVHVDANGDPLFHAGDLCDLLEHTNSRRALTQHVEPDDVTKRYVIDRLGRTQSANFVTEPGMWSLVLGSHAPNARKVKRWVTSEVLPAIRKTGRYQVPTAAPDPAPEQISADDLANLQRLVWLCTGRMHHEKAWISAVWAALRKATDCPAPRRFEVRHLPLLAAEMRRILQAVNAYLDHRAALEEALCKRVLRAGEDVAAFTAKLAAEEAVWRNDLAPWVGKIDAWAERDFTALVARTPATGWDTRGYAEPALPAGGCGMSLRTYRYASGFLRTERPAEIEYYRRIEAADWQDAAELAAEDANRRDVSWPTEQDIWLIDEATGEEACFAVSMETVPVYHAARVQEGAA